METRRRSSGSSTRLPPSEDNLDPAESEPLVHSAEDVVMLMDPPPPRRPIASQIPSRKSGRSGAVPPKTKAAQPKKWLKRRNSSKQDGATATAQSKNKESSQIQPSVLVKRPIVELDDPDPGRLTNPLVEDHNVVMVQDLLSVTNGIEFHRPDTYSLHYYAKLLGLQDEMMALSIDPNDDDGQTDGMVPTQQLLDHLKSTDLLEPSKTDPIFHIPPLGTVPEHLRFWGEDDCALLKEQADQFDPLFDQLVNLPVDQAVRVVVTASQNVKLLQLNQHSSSGPSAAAAPVSRSPSYRPPLQQAVLDAVLIPEEEILQAHNLSYRNEYDFLPLEQARELFPTAIQGLLDTTATSNPNILTGWVVVTKLAKPVPQEDETVERDPEDAADDLSCSFTDDMNSSEHASAISDPNFSAAATTTTTTRTTPPDRRRVVGGVLCQLEWYRSSAENRMDAAEAIVHVLGLTTNLGTLSNDNEEPLPDEEAQSWMRMVLTALVLEQARACQIWYVVFGRSSDNDGDFLATYFRATSSTVSRNVVADIHKTSARYSFLRFLEERRKMPSSSPRKDRKEYSSTKRRWLVRLPTVEEARAALIPPEDEAVDQLNQRPQRGLVRRSSSSNFSTGSSVFVTSASKAQRNISLSIRAVMSTGDNESMNLLRINEDGSGGQPLDAPKFYKELASLDILRHFPLEGPPHPLSDEETRKSDTKDEQEDLILQEITRKQQQLRTLESSFGPPLRSLLHQVVTERIQYESTEAAAQRAKEKQVLVDAQKMLERRKELDVAWQKQLEQDMDAVCEICRDGEVTPDNQILFCEACNVAVHQYCYGIDKIPEGDYYCMPCRRLGRDKHMDAPHLAAAIPQPLPVCCELCPLRQGAFIRTATKPLDGGTGDRWVHVVCAKWQGLNFVDSETVEDVTQVRIGFRQHGIKCELCQGERGAMNKCSGAEDCNTWFHISCARAVGTLKVTHGENCKGPVEENPWSLCCPEHSNIPPEDVPKDATLVDKLVLAAQEFPPEPCPPPAPRPFNQLNGPERKALLADPDYESKLMFELLRKRFYGVRCEVCDALEEESKNLTRCALCNVVFCNSCKLQCDEIRGNYKCLSCRFVETTRKAGEEVEVPECCACFQPGGLLRETVAEPVTKLGYWYKNPNELEKSLFRKKLWIHSVCAFWSPKLVVPADTGVVDLSNVIMTDGKSLVQNRILCVLCCQRGGLKMRCDVEGCVLACEGSGRSEPMSMHVTCARQAGFEVRFDDKNEIFYVRCYRHGNNEYNLRARLEDLIEIEKRRSGKDLSRSDAPMNFADGSRIMNAAVQVMKTLGWAWRWAEWWVDYNSTWEPLLEPGQKESRMTKGELKIVDSTRQSRCSDARKCRLAAFGAALRNRDYDTTDGFNREAFDNAIRAVLHTRSLVGPLEEYEINFFADWLGRAYRSKSRLLGFGEDKIKVSEKSNFALHIRDHSQKYTLGNRPLPGSGALQEDGIFEVDVDDVDDFMLRDLVAIQPKSAKPVIKLKSAKPVIKLKSAKPRHNSRTTTDVFEKLEAERKRLRNERDRARRERKRLEQLNAVSSKKSARAAKQRSDSVDEAGSKIASTSVKRRGRPPRNRGTALVVTEEKRRPGRPRKIPVPVATMGSEGVGLRPPPRRKRRNQSTGESDSDEDYVDEVAMPPTKRRRGRLPKDRSTESRSPNAGRPHSRDQRKRQRSLRELRKPADNIDAAEDAAEVAEDYRKGNESFEESHDFASSSRSPRRRNGAWASKFDLIKSRRRQTRSTMNVGSGSSSKSYDVPMRPGDARKVRTEDSDDEGLPISDLVLRRKEHVETLLLPPVPQNSPKPAASSVAFGPESPNVTLSGESGGLASFSSQQAVSGSTNPDTGDEYSAGPSTTKESLAARPNARSKVDSDDTPQKRGRRRGKQQAVDQLSLTLSQIK